MDILSQPSLFDATPQGKHCPLCNKSKPFAFFGKDIRKKDGLYPCCKLCRRNNKRVSEPKKWCPVCEKWHPQSNFHVAKTRTDGLLAFCKPCGRSRQRAEYNQNPDVMRERHFKRSYGITIEEYNCLLKKQNHLCAICQKPETETHWKGKEKGLAVDHCHSTKKVRGLLCAKCNQAIGNFQDNEKLLLAAIAYLTESRESNP